MKRNQKERGNELLVRPKLKQEKYVCKRVKKVFQEGRKSSSICAPAISMENVNRSWFVNEEGKNELDKSLMVLVKTDGQETIRNS